MVTHLSLLIYVFTLSRSNPTSTDKKPFYFGNVVFEWLFPVVTAIVAGAELMLREQVLLLIVCIACFFF